MAKRNAQQNYGSIITQLESWNSSYSLNSEKYSDNEYFKEYLEIFAKVTFSEHKRIEIGDLMCFHVFVEHDMRNSVPTPKYISIFNRSKKCRTAYLSVHKSFLDNFRFLVNNNIKPYLICSYLNRDNEKDIAITSFYLESNVEIDDYKTR